MAQMNRKGNITVITESMPAMGGQDFFGWAGGGEGKFALYMSVSFVAEW
jgi:hypothetical protein